VSEAPKAKTNGTAASAGLAGHLEYRHQFENACANQRARIRTDAKTEVAMTTFTHPPKQLVRAYLERRSRDPKPPPSPEEIRRQLGWGLAASEFKMGECRS
jgi:hypothetical protein